MKDSVKSLDLGALTSEKFEISKKIVAHSLALDTESVGAEGGIQFLKIKRRRLARELAQRVNRESPSRRSK